MTETVQEVYGNAAGLLVRLGYAARMDPAYRPAGQPRPVVAIVTDCPPVVLGHAISQVAVNPEPFLPTRSVKAPRAALGKPGDPQLAWWV